MLGAALGLLVALGLIGAAVEAGNLGWQILFLGPVVLVVGALASLLMPRTIGMVAAQVGSVIAVLIAGFHLHLIAALAFVGVFLCAMLVQHLARVALAPHLY